MNMPNLATLKINLTRSNSPQKDIAIKRILFAESERDRLNSMLKHREPETLVNQQRDKVGELINSAYLFGNEVLKTGAIRQKCSI